MAGISGQEADFWYCAYLILQQLTNPDVDTQHGKRGSDSVATAASSVVIDHHMLCRVPSIE